jgi:RNA polymerase sigma-70 factor (ECF subfamily)
MLAVLGDRIVGAVVFEIDDGRIASAHGFAAPARLARLTETWRQREPDAPIIAEW